MKKKAVSMPMNTIIIALLVLAVLVVLLFMFGSRMKIFGKAIHKSCTQLGGGIPTPALSHAEHTQYVCQDNDKPILIWVSNADSLNEGLGQDGVYPCCVPIGVAG